MRRPQPIRPERSLPTWPNVSKRDTRGGKGPKPIRPSPMRIEGRKGRWYDYLLIAAPLLFFAVALFVEYGRS